MFFSINALIKALAVGVVTLQLQIQHHPVGNDHHAVEQTFVTAAVQGGQPACLVLLLPLPAGPSTVIVSARVQRSPCVSSSRLTGRETSTRFTVLDVVVFAI